MLNPRKEYRHTWDGEMHSPLTRGKQFMYRPKIPKWEGCKQRRGSESDEEEEGKEEEEECCDCGGKGEKSFGGVLRGLQSKRKKRGAKQSGSKQLNKYRLVARLLLYARMAIAMAMVHIRNTCTYIYMNVCVVKEHMSKCLWNPSSSYSRALFHTHTTL